MERIAYLLHLIRYALTVTDPTKPFPTFIRPGLSLDYRGLAVEPTRKILAVTDSLLQSSYSGNVVFYDLSTSPDNPVWIGEQTLADGSTGLPTKVAMSGDYAYIATTYIGLQVVNLDAAIQAQTGNSAIVGTLDTIGMGYNQPEDIVVYQPGRALLTTSAGYLLVLDINMPQPMPLAAYKPDGYAAWRVAAAAGYAFTDTAGNFKTIDLAVTSGLQKINGQTMSVINTLDVTDPYNPNLLGVVTDSQGNVVNCYATDIAISKISGLAYLSAGTAIYVVDIKDPNHPMLLNKIDNTPSAPGSGNYSLLGNSSALVEQGGWVYLANQQKGMRVLDLDPVYIGIEETMPLVSKDYYPVLGTKAIRVWGDVNGSPANNEWELCLTEDAPNFEIGVALDAATNRPTDLLTPAHCSGSFVPEADGKGYMPLYIRWKGWDSAANTQLPPSVELKIRAKKRNVSTRNLVTTGSIPNASEICKECKITVRHNGNVDMSQVLAGTAVFVFDGGRSPGNADINNGQKGFYYVQELLNQVVPRGRSMYNDDPATNATTPWITNTYQLIDEDGIYSTPTYSAVKNFKQSYGIDSNNDIFKKLAKDYSLVDPSDNSFSWRFKIVEKETLIGKTQSDADTIPNTAANNKGNKDTGLYELYKNVVEKFVNKMIAEAELYAGVRQPDSDEQPVTDNWISRTGEGPTGTANPPGPHGQGMSYSWDGKMNIALFNAQVAPTCSKNAEKILYGVYSTLKRKQLADPAIPYRTGYIDPVTLEAGPPPPGTDLNPTKVDMNYKGNLDDACDLVSGESYKYPGLKKHENDSNKQYNLTGYSTGDKSQIVYFNLLHASRTTFLLPQYKADYWAGIDCSGLVQRAINAADKLGIPGASSAVPMLGDSGSYGQYTKTAVNTESLGCDQCVNDYSYRISYDPEDAAPTLKNIKKGDLVKYDGHMSMIYSDRPTCLPTLNASGEEETACTYEIVHAYGGTPYQQLDENGKKVGDPIFSRKVIKTKNNISSEPTGFGRIKLWD